MNKYCCRFYLKKASNELYSYEFLSKELQHEIQWDKLKRMLYHAYHQTAFYKQRFDKAGIHPRDIETFKDFERVPVLTRDDILENYEGMLAYPKNRLVMGKTGGSSGHPLTFYSQPEYKYLIKKAQIIRIEKWLGAYGSKPVFHIWGVNGRNNVPNHLNHWHLATKKKYCYAFKTISSKELEKLADDFLTVKPNLIYGYVSLLRLLAEYMIFKETQSKGSQRTIIATAETLTEADRELIENGLGGKVYNIYGSHENGFLAAECMARKGLHIFAEHAYLEVIGKNGTSLIGEPGYCVVTDLDNWGMPFIRYRNEDIVSLTQERCGCTRSYPMLAAVYGRENDFIIDKEYYAYPNINFMRILRAIAENGCIKQVQLIQSSPGQMKVLAVPGFAPEPLSREEIVRILQAEFQGKIEIDFEFVDAISPEASGKTRFIKSSIPYHEVFRMTK